MFDCKNVQMTQKKALCTDLVKKMPDGVCQKQIGAQPLNTKSFYHGLNDIF